MNYKITCLEMKERRNFEVLSSVKCDFFIFICVNLTVCTCSGRYNVCHACTCYMDIFMAYEVKMCFHVCTRHVLRLDLSLFSGHAGSLVNIQILKASLFN